jgi:hypothetical protein
VILAADEGAAERSLGRVVVERDARILDERGSDAIAPFAVADAASVPRHRLEMAMLSLLSLIVQWRAMLRRSH